VPLLLMTPGAEPLVGEWRAEHDWAAAHGVPAHVTVRMPFLEPPQWNDPRLHELREFLPSHVTLARLEDRPGALVIVAEPDDHLRELTDAIGTLWPTLPPHKPGYESYAYHVTVARTADAEVRSQASAALAPHLPLAVTGTEFWAAHGSPDAGLKTMVVATSERSE
jgi:hypothetical protein